MTDLIKQITSDLQKKIEVAEKENEEIRVTKKKIVKKKTKVKSSKSAAEKAAANNSAD